jgi:hypothetical protein
MRHFVPSRLALHVVELGNGELLDNLNLERGTKLIHTTRLQISAGAEVRQKNLRVL